MSAMETPLTLNSRGFAQVILPDMQDFRDRFETKRKVEES